MTTLVVGGSGATGRFLIDQLLKRQHHVRSVVRSLDRLPQTLLDHPNLTVIEASIADASTEDFASYVDGCDAIASCLGHRLTFKGLFGHPRRLVTDATRRLCHAASTNAALNPIKFVLMNTAGNSNRDLDEPISFAQRCLIHMLRLTVPPLADNELAADHLRTEIGQKNPSIEWVAVRPDTLTNAPSVTQYCLHSSPTRSALFNPGKTSRVNVAHFMAELIHDNTLWAQWKGQMPVIYNASE